MMKHRETPMKNYEKRERTMKNDEKQGNNKKQ